MPDRKQPDAEPNPGSSYRSLPMLRRRFVDSLTGGLNATQAAEAAGYSSRNRHSLESQGSRLLRNGEVRSAIEERVAGAASAAGVSAESIFTGLRTIAENGSDPATAARVAAWRELAERVIGPAEQLPPQRHLHVAVSPAAMRRVAARLSAELGAPEPEPPPPVAN